MPSATAATTALRSNIIVHTLSIFLSLSCYVRITHGIYNEAASCWHHRESYFLCVCCDRTDNCSRSFSLCNKCTLSLCGTGLMHTHTHTQTNAWIRWVHLCERPEVNFHQSSLTSHWHRRQCARIKIWISLSFDAHKFGLYTFTNAWHKPIGNYHYYQTTDSKSEHSTRSVTSKEASSCPFARAL